MRPLALLAIIAIAVAGCDSKPQASTGGSTGQMPEPAAQMTLTSTAFQNGSPMPESRTPPPLAWSGAPATAKSFAITCYDPDAGTNPFMHWMVANIPADVSQLDGNLPNGAIQGKNSAEQEGYYPPNPPTPDPAHHYNFKVFALDTVLSLQPGFDSEQLRHAMEGHVVGSAQLIGTFKGHE